MNKKFGRIFKDKLEYAPDALQLQGMMVHNPIDAVYQQHGWYKIVERHPAAKAGYDEVFEGYKLDHISKILYMQIVLFGVSIIMISIAVGGVMWIGEMVGRYAGGAAIVAAFFLLVLGVLVLLRKRLFRDTFVPLFIDLFFEENK